MTCRLTAAQNKAIDVLISDATNLTLFGGSRSGKTFLLIRAIIIRALKAKDSNHGIFRHRFNHLKASIIHGTFPKVIALCFPELQSQLKWNKTDWFVEFPNGSRIWFGGLDSAERSEKILGQEFSTLYFNECSQIPYLSILNATTRLAEQNELIKRIYYDFNPPPKTHWTYKLFVEKIDPFTKKQVENPSDYAHFVMNPKDNLQNLDPNYLKTLAALPPSQRDRFLFGLFAGDEEGLLWPPEVIEQQRIMNATGLPDYQRVVVAIDPSGSRGEDDMASDEIGIVMAALGTNGKGYLLQDASGRYRPEQWAQTAVDLYKRNNADFIVGERNYGGDMVRAMIHSIDPTVPFKEVTASRGKVVRAEPIAAMYHSGLLYHIGQFTELEDEMMAMSTTGFLNMGSPNRVDAMVWAFTELFSDVSARRDALRQQNVAVVTGGRAGSWR